MRAKTYKELYAILLRKLELGYGWSGICLVITRLHSAGEFTEDEMYKLQTHFKKQKPTARNKFSLFYADPLFINGLWWWRPMDAGSEYREIRIKFIKAIIRTLK